jgi:hypothetical protein
MNQSIIAACPALFQILSIGMFENKICHNITEYKYFLYLRGRVAKFRGAAPSEGCGREFVAMPAVSMFRCCLR